MDMKLCSEKRCKLLAAIAVHPLVRSVVLGVLGYFIFAIFAVMICKASQFLSIRDFRVIDWHMGAIVSLVFASSEILNTGRRNCGNGFRRIGVSSATMVFSCQLGFWISDKLGWRNTYEQQARMGFYQTCLCCAIFAVVMILIRSLGTVLRRS